MGFGDAFGNVKDERPTQSQTEMGLLGRCSHTCFNCQTAFSIGFSQLVIRSCLKGNAQLPESSGIQAIVLYP